MTRERERERHKEIVSAARWCFSSFGFAKTSLDDIAKRANISRPLVYRSFANKDDIYRAVIEDGFDARFPVAEQVLAGAGGKLEKLTRIAEIMMLEPWAELAGAPMAAEFYATSARVCPEVVAKQQRRMLKLLADLVGGKDPAEVFLLAFYGMVEDLPTTTVLRRRIVLLAERFSA